MSTSTAWKPLTAPRMNAAADAAARFRRRHRLGRRSVTYRAIAQACRAEGLILRRLGALPAPGMALMFCKEQMILVDQRLRGRALLFVLAHEMGHVLLGHVSENRKQRALVSGFAHDVEVLVLEQEADEFARRILGWREAMPIAQITASMS